MQIACKRFSCQKAVEVCYWACKYRRDCKDWHSALAAAPGTDAIAGQLAAAAKKSGRMFDPQTMTLASRTKKSRAALVSKPPSAHLEAQLQSGGISTARGETDSGNSIGQGESPSHKRTTKTKPGKVKRTMTEENLDSSLAEASPESSLEISDAGEATAETKTKPAAAKAKPKPVVAKPKPVAQNNGPVYLLLYANGKYKELRESELNTEAASVLKDPSLRLIKGQALIPQISFKTAEE